MLKFLPQWAANFFKAFGIITQSTICTFHPIRRKSKRIQKKSWAFTSIVSLLIIATILLFYGHIITFFQNKIFDSMHTGFDSEDIAQLGQIGDFWGGMINPLIGIVTIFFLAINYLISSEQLKNANEHSTFDNEFKLISPKLDKIEQLASTANAVEIAQMLLKRFMKIAEGRPTASIVSDLNELSNTDEIKLIKLIGAALVRIADSNLPDDKKSVLIKDIKLNLGHMEPPLMMMVAINAFRMHDNDLYFKSLQSAIFKLKIFEQYQLLPEYLHRFLGENTYMDANTYKIARNGMKLIQQFFCGTENSNVSYTTTQETINCFYEAQKKSPFDLMIVETTLPRRQFICKFPHNEKALNLSNLTPETIKSITSEHKDFSDAKLYKIEFITGYNAREVIRDGHLNNSDFIKFIESEERLFEIVM